MSYTIYIGCIMEPTSASGGVSATPLGDTVTQRILKTSLGDTSMNIAQSVARIRASINAVLLWHVNW